MIADFKDDEARIIFNGGTSKKLPADIQNTARRRLVLLDAATSLSDLTAYPGNRLEKLSGGHECQ